MEYKLLQLPNTLKNALAAVMDLSHFSRYRTRFSSENGEISLKGEIW